MQYVNSFIAVLEVVLLFSSMKYGFDNYDILNTAIRQHMVLFLAAYGPDEARPKHHYSLHLPRMLRKFGVLIGTLTMERKHRVVRRCTRDRRNPTKWNLGSLEEVTVNQLREQARQFIKSGHLAAARTRPDDLSVLLKLFPNVDAADFSVCAHIRGKHGESRIGDVVLYYNNDDHAVMCVGQLLVNFAVKHQEYSVVEMWTPMHTDESPSFLRKFRIEPELLQVLTTSVICSLTHRPPSGSSRICFVTIPKCVN